MEWIKQKKSEIIRFLNPQYPEQFKGVYKYKFIVPMILISSWMMTLMVLINPQYFPLFAKCGFYYVAFIIFPKQIYSGLAAIYGYIKATKILDRFQKRGDSYVQNQHHKVNNLTYAFIIPNYKEDIAIIRSTLKHIASHPRAKTHYAIFLAMEYKQENCDIKAKKICEEFKDKFLMINFTIHQLKGFQQQGKASNVSFCAQNIEKYLDEKMIDTDNVMVVDLDVDSWIPSCFIEEIELFLEQKFDQRHRYLFAPLQMFAKNHYDVPIFTRIMDDNSGFVNFVNSTSVFGTGFPLSNYVISFKTIKEIGYWDTIPDAIGEDFHTTIKCFWKRGGDFQVKPIYTMFNLLSVQTGKGYLQDMIARFWQAERHARGIGSVSYCFKKFVEKPFNLKSTIISLSILEMNVSASFFFYSFFSSVISIIYPGMTEESQVQNRIMTALFFLQLLIQVLYVLIKMRSNQLLYKRKYPSFWLYFIRNIIEITLLYTINLISYIIIPFTLAVFNNLRNQHQEYRTAEKVISIEQKNQQKDN